MLVHVIHSAVLIVVYVSVVLSRTFGVGCTEINFNDSISIRLDGGRSTRKGQPYDGYVAVIKGGSPIGYVCSKDVGKRQLHANATCQTLGFTEAYDVPTDNRYGTPPSVLTPYQLSCANEHSQCNLEKMREECPHTNVLSVWCIKDYSFRLVTDDNEKLLAQGFFVYYLNFSWWKLLPRNQHYNIICQEYGFAVKARHYLIDKDGSKNLTSIPAEANYNFGKEDYVCEEACTWKLKTANMKKPYPDFVVCANGTAQDILDRINPPTASTIATAQDVSEITAPPSQISNEFQKDPESPKKQDTVAIAVGTCCAVFLFIILVIIVMYLIKKPLLRKSQAEHRQTTEETTAIDLDEQG